MKLRKLVATTLAVALVASSVTACGNKGASGDSGTTPPSSNTATATPTPEAEKITLTVWGPQEDQSSLDGYKDGILKAMCEAFDEAHPEWEITFKYGVCSEGDAKDTVTKDVAGAADVYMFANDQIPILAEAGALAKLGGTTVDQIKADNDQTMIDSVTYNGDVYGVPFTSNTWFMYYDTSKYTADEVKSLDTMMSKDLGDDVYNFAFALDNSWYIEAFYYGAGGTLFGDGTDASAGCDWDNENGVAATKYMVNLANNKKFSLENNQSSLAKFKEGKLGAYCSGSWDAAAIKESLGENFGATKIPTVTINGKEGQLKSFAGSKAIGVNPSSKNLPASVALAAYLGGKECQEIRFEARGIIPTNKEVQALDAVKNDVVASAQALEIAEAAVVQPVLAEMGKYWTPAESMGKEITQGNVTEANAQEKTKQMVEGILAK